MEIILKNFLLICGIFFMIDFIAQHPEVFIKIDNSVDAIKNIGSSE